MNPEPLNLGDKGHKTNSELKGPEDHRKVNLLKTAIPVDHGIYDINNQMY